MPRGKKCVKKQAENWSIPINGHLIDSNELIDENLLVYEPAKRSKVILTHIILGTSGVFSII